MPRLKTYKLGGQPFRACGPGCADGFKTDRRYGAIYGVSIEGRNKGAIDRESDSMALGFCAYCSAPTCEDCGSLCNLDAAGRVYECPKCDA